MAPSPPPGATGSDGLGRKSITAHAIAPGEGADRCFHCGRAVYGLQTIGGRRVCGRADCLRAALASVELDQAA